MESQSNFIETFLTFVSPLLSGIDTMMSDINASHVLRFSICALTGMPVIKERKGKESKHKHSCTLAEPMEKLVDPNKYYISKDVCFHVPAEFHGMYSSL